MTAPPPDVLVGRAIRALTRVLLIGCGAAAALGLAAVAVLILAGAADVRPVLSLLAIGQIAALATAGVGGLGMGEVLRSRSGASAGTAATPDDAARAAATRTTAARRLGVLARVTGVAAVVAVAGWALAAPGSALGALLGAVVAAQVAVLDVVLGRRLAAGVES